MREVKNMLGQLAQDRKTTKEFLRNEDGDLDRASADDQEFDEQHSLSETYESDQLRDYISKQRN